MSTSVTWHGDKILTAITAEVTKALEMGGRLVETAAKRRIMSGGRSGNIYKRGAKTHQASAVGEPPKTDTGYLASNIITETNGLKVRVISQAEYSKILEYNMNRPFMFPSFEENKRNIEKLVAGAVKRGSSS